MRSSESSSPAIYADPAFKSVLFVGVGPYTSWYPTLFRTRPHLSFITIDSNPAVAHWGAKGRHRISRLECLADESASRDAYDLVVANGLFGFGTDSDRENAAVVDACHAVLKPGGRLLIGYSEPGTFYQDHVDTRHFLPSRIPGLAVDRFEARSENRHRFACFTKT